MKRLAVSCWLLMSMSGCAHGLERKEMSFDTVAEEARILAEQRYQPLTRPLPQGFRTIDYDHYRNIRFVPERSLWLMEDIPFTVQLFHRGYLFQEPVLLREYSSSHVQDIPYVRDFFQFSDLDIPEFPNRHAAYAGWRLHAPLNRSDYFDEVIAFLGASYFRAVGRGNQYGLSARGLLLPHRPDEQEEFPRFTQFWIQKPAPGAESMTALALLDSPSVSGAYSFTITPGDPTHVEIRARLFPRRDGLPIGIAPLTSMFYYGENTHPKPMDFRPEVHDSDGLSVIYKDGRALWRPLNVGSQLHTHELPAEGMQAFALIQRDRNFQHYLDDETNYHRRPSVRVVPKSPFPRGKVVLLELPPAGEFEDNIVVYYQPDEPASADQPIDLHYTLHWGTLSLSNNLGRVYQTRYGEDFRFPSDYVFFVEFSAPEQGFPESMTATIEPPVGFRVRTHLIEVHPETNRAQLRIILTAEDELPSVAQIRATLQSGDGPVSETWVYQWNP